jgi:hypothetical protein
LFDQTPKSEENAKVVWISKAISKAFVAFPGDLLHGVLPCISNNVTEVTNNKSHDDDENEAVTDNQTPTHRLTFMVNFWGTRIPDRIKDLKLYGPSGPFPPRTAEHSWVEDITGDDYPKTVEMPGSPIPPSKNYDGIDSVSPAWETVHLDETTTITNSSSTGQQQGPHLPLSGESILVDEKEWEVPSCCHSLELPVESGIHQRFFVKDAPDYFRGTLYEK